MIGLAFGTDPALLQVAFAAILLNGASASSAFRGELPALNTQLALAAPASRVVSVEVQGKQKIGKDAIL